MMWTISILWCFMAHGGDPSISVDEAGVDAEGQVGARVQGPDRSSPPPVVPPSLLAHAEPRVHELSPGVSVRLVPLAGVRKVYVDVRFHRGSLDADGEPTEVADATGWLQDVATEAYDSVRLETTEALMDLSVRSNGWDLHTASLQVEVPRNRLEEGFEVFADILRHPTYPAGELRRYSLESARWLTDEGPVSPSAVASALIEHGWYPDDHPWGARPDLAALRHLKRRELMRHHEWLLANAPVTVLVVGDVTWDDVRPMLAAAFEGVGAPGEPVDPPAFTPPSSSRVLAVDFPGQPQAAIRLRLAAPTYDSSDRVSFAVVDWALGGHFLSRLNKNLREEKGLTYGSRSRYQPGFTEGLFEASVDVQGKDVGLAIREIERELSRVVTEGLTDEELRGYGRDLVMQWNAAMLTARSGARFYQGILSRKESVADVIARIETTRALSVNQTGVVAERWIGAEAPRLWAVVGDRSVVGPQLEEMGLEVTWLDAKQAMLGEFH